MKPTKTPFYIAAERYCKTFPCWGIPPDLLAAKYKKWMLKIYFDAPDFIKFTNMDDVHNLRLIALLLADIIWKEENS